MRIEVLVGSEDPIIFPLKSSKVIIGSGENCDVTLDASGISRKHIAVITEGDQYFVVDQGSTNGSFINEERMIPGKKVEFTSFFPVRLGDNVLISLLSDEEDIDYHIPVPGEKSSPNISVPREREDATTVIKLNDLKKVKTDNLVLERNQKRDIRKKAAAATAKNPPKAPPKKKGMGVVQLSAILLVAVAAYFNFFHMKNVEDNEPVREIGKVISVEKIEPAKEAVTFTVPEKDLPPRESFDNILNDIKCATDVEKYLCNTIPAAKEGQYGATQVGLTMKVATDGSLYLNEARKLVRPPTETTPEAIEAYEKLVRKTAAFIFVMRFLPPLDETLLKDNELVIAFFVSKEGIPTLEYVLAFYPKVFNEHKPSLKESDLYLIKNNGETALTNFNSYFTVY